MTNHIYHVEYKNEFKNRYYNELGKIKAESVLYLYGRDDNKKKVIKTIRGFFPYFYIESGKIIPDELKEYIYKIDDKEYKNILGEKVTRIFTFNPTNVKFMRDILDMYNIRSFEADVLYVLRFLIDNKDELSKMDMDLKGEWRKMYIDIETTMQYGGVDVKAAKEQITCVGCYDNYNKKYYCFLWHPDYNKIKDIRVEGVVVNAYPDEETMLRGWLNFYQECNPDILLGYNCSEFDIPYIARRLDILRIGKDNLCVNKSATTNGGYWEWESENGEWLNPNINGLVIFDVFKYYKKINLNEIASYSLDNVAKEELDEGKVEVKNIEQCWRETPELFIQYNKKDSELTMRIEEKRELVEFVNTMRSLVGINFNDFEYFSRMVDILLLRHARNKGIILPSKPKTHEKYIPKDEREANYEGGFVDCVKGLYKNVCNLDLKTLYPTIIKGMNISFETLRTDGSGEIKIGDVSYTTKQIGIIPSVIDDTLKLSAGYKKLRNESDVHSYEYKKYANLYEASKFIVLALYGVQATPVFRLYDVRNADSITRVGREIIKFTRDIVESEGHKNIQSDTDSTYVALNENFKSKEVCVAEGLRLVNLINERYNDFAKSKGVSSHYFEIKMEKFLSRMLAGKRKRYSCIEIWKESKNIDDGWLDKPKFISVGFETNRSSSSALTKEIQAEVMQMILNDKSYDEIKEYVINKSTDIQNGKLLPSILALPTAINKSHYENNLPVTRALEWSNRRLKTNYKVGQKNLMIYVIDPRNETDVVMFEHNYEFDESKKLGIEIDKIKMIERDILMPLTTIFEAINWDIEKIRQDIMMKIEGQTTLF